MVSASLSWRLLHVASNVDVRHAFLHDIFFYIMSYQFVIVSPPLCAGFDGPCRGLCRRDAVTLIILQETAVADM